MRYDKQSRHLLDGLVGLSAALALLATQPASAANGDLVGTVTFGADCASGIGVGITFDGTYLWYTCYQSTVDLIKADPTTGAVIQTFSVLGGLGSIAYDNSRNMIWAAAGCGPGQTGSEVWLIDPATGKATLQFNVPGYAGTCLVDGLGYDGSNDTLYHSFDGALSIRHLSTSGAPQSDDGFPWSGAACYNSGVAIGGQLLFEGSDGCSQVWVVDKVSKAPAFNFSTIVAGDPNFRDESLTCDEQTFSALGKTVMWSKEAYSPMRAHAFEIPAGSCVSGGGSIPGYMTGGGTIAGTAVHHGFALDCSVNKGGTLEINWGPGKSFHLTALTTALCTMDKSFSPTPPVAPFDEYRGSGTGTYNGVPGATAQWTFTDAGEPGTKDTATIKITDAGGTVVLKVSGTLSHGNQQAHAPSP